MPKPLPALLLFLITIVNSQTDSLKPNWGTNAMIALTVTSTAFKQMQPIPEAYTCDGADRSPPLSWSDPPASAKSMALICDDPDAPRTTWVHWVVYDLPPTCKGLPEGVKKTNTLAIGGKQGKNDFPEIGYNGPCPPGGTHRYFFKVYALDALLGLPPGKTKHEVEMAMQGHIVAQGELIGIYTRK